ncbi:MAG: sodium:alanine symporter family protein, partial [Peptococcaceae bacterium]|nr:sodium:alanine symporter family protein [Peptococcaceae bacterium]
MEAFASIVSTISSYLYGYILIALLFGAGIYFTIRTKFVLFRLLGESIRVIKEPKKEEKATSS